MTTETIEDYEIAKLEKEWLETQPRFSARELLSIFPEAREYFEYRLKRIKETSKKLSKEIYQDLKRIYQDREDFSQWFWVEVIRTFKGEILNKLEKEIWRIQFLLSPVNEKKGITLSMIQEARRFSMPALLGLPVEQKTMSKCPFHSERTPSFWITQNNDGTWVAYCFGACKKGWDTIQLLMDKDNLSFKEVVKKLN